MERYPQEHVVPIYLYNLPERRLLPALLHTEYTPSERPCLEIGRVLEQAGGGPQCVNVLPHCGSDVHVLSVGNTRVIGNCAWFWPVAQAVHFFFFFVQYCFGSVDAFFCVANIPK